MDNKDIMSGGEIAYGKPVIFSIVSNANYRLGAIKQGSSDVDISKIKERMPMEIPLTRTRLLV